MTSPTSLQKAQTSLDALIERVRGLTGPDRETDALVMAACFDWAKPEPPYLAPQCIGDEPIYWHAPEPYRKREVPELTASVDAAIALVDRLWPDEQAVWTLATDFGGLRRAHLHTFPNAWVPTGQSPGRNYQEDGPTPAIALVLAILTALQEEGRDG